MFQLLLYQAMDISQQKKQTKQKAQKERLENEMLWGLRVCKTQTFSWEFRQPCTCPGLCIGSGKMWDASGLTFFFFFNFIYLFIYFWLCWVPVPVRGPSLVAASGGHSSSRCAGLSLSRPLLLRSTGSKCAGSVVVAHGPSCSVACGILPDQGSNPCPLRWQADSQPLHHQGNPLGWLWGFKKAAVIAKVELQTAWLSLKSCLIHTQSPSAKTGRYFWFQEFK